MGLLEVVDKFLVFVSIVDREFEFAFFGPEDDGLPLHAADHVEGRFGLTAQRQLQQVFLDAGLDGFTQLGGDFEKTIRWTEAFNALVRPFVVVITDPKSDAFASRFEALELGAREELLPDGLPEPLDLAQRHRMVRPGLEVVRAVLLHLGLETGGAAPIDILPAIVREHLFRRLIFTGRHAKDLQHVLGGVAAKQVAPDDEARVVIHEGDEVGVTAAQPEGEDVRLPHLIGGRPLEETRPHQVARRLGASLLHQALFLECFTNGGRAGLEKEHPLEQLGDPLDTAGGVFLFELNDLLADRFGQPGSGLPGEVGLEPLLALLAIALGPFINRGSADPQLLADQFLGEALFEVELDGAKTFFKRERQTFSRSAPRGGGVVLLLL